MHKTNAPIVPAFVSSSFQSLLLLFSALFFSLSLCKNVHLSMAGIPMAMLLGGPFTVLADFSYIQVGSCPRSQTLGASIACDPPISTFLPYSVRTKLCCLLLVSFG